MSQAYGQCSLYLHPSPHNFIPENVPPLITELQKINFISQAINKQNNHSYFTGDKFFDYITYMGCSPAIQFKASPDNYDNSDDFCHIKMHHHKTTQLIYNQKQATSPLCPNCRKPVKNWQDTKVVRTIKCNQCNTSSNIEDFNWRKMAGYAQLFIEITDIFPKEAIPQQLLLDKLADITGAKWQYFYNCQ